MPSIKSPWEHPILWGVDLPRTTKDRPMAQYFLVAALVFGLSAPALAAKRYGSVRDPYRGCKIVNIAPNYAQTTIRKGKRVYVTRPTTTQDMAIICPPSAAW